MAKTFDGPPTLERSGSEHRRAVTSPLPEEEGLGEKVELSLQERRRGRKVSTEGGYILSSLREERLGEKGGAFLKGKEGRVGFRKDTPINLWVIEVVISYSSFSRRSAKF